MHVQIISGSGTCHIEARQSSTLLSSHDHERLQLPDSESSPISSFNHLVQTPVPPRTLTLSMTTGKLMYPV